MSGRFDSDDDSLVPLRLFEETINGLERLAREAVKNLGNEYDTTSAQCRRLEEQLEVKEVERQAEEQRASKLFATVGDLEAEVAQLKEALERTEERDKLFREEVGELELNFAQTKLLLDNERQRVESLRALNSEVMKTVQGLKRALGRLCAQNGLDLNVLLKEMASSEQGSQRRVVQGR